MKNSGGLNGIRTHELCDAGAMLYKLNSVGSMSCFAYILAWPVLCHASVCLDSADRLAELYEHQTTVEEVAG